MKKFLLKAIAIVAAMGFCSTNAMAADPDLANDYTLVRSATFGGAEATNIAGSVACDYTAYDTGNKKQQTLTVATAPSDAAGWIAFQAWTDGSGKGWWNRADNSLYCYNAGRSAAVFGSDLTIGWIVVFECKNQASTCMTLVNGNGDPDGTFSYVTSEDGKSYFCTINAKENAYIGFCGNKNAQGITKISVYKPNKAVVPTTYKVAYVDGDNNVLKDTVEYNGIAGNKVSLSDADKANISYEGNTYLYSSDNSADVTIAEDGSSVATVTFRKAANFTYTVKEVYGDVVLRETTGTSYETASVTVPYRKYNTYEGKLYTKGATDKEYNHKFKLTADNQVETLSYDEVAGVENVVFLTEGEDIEGMTACTTANTGIRSSNSSSAYASEDVKIANLDNGTYKMHAVIYDASKEPNSNWKFYLNDATQTEAGNFTCTTVNFQEFESEFAVKSSTDLMFSAAGSASMGIDMLYIVKTGNVNFTEIKAVKDTVVIEKGSGFGLSDIVTINSSADMSQFSGMNMFNAKLGIAAAGEGTDKATATYTESGLLGSISMISTVGDYYVYAKIPVTYQDQSTEDVISDTLVVQVKDVYYLNVEENLPDTIKYLKGTDEDMKPMLSNYMTAVSDGVLSADMFIANAIEGVTKEDATYAGYDNEEDAKNAMSTPGAYFAYGVVTASYDDKDPLTYTTDTIVIVVSDPNQFEIETMLEYQEIADNATADEVKDFFAVYTANTADMSLYIGVAKAENDEVDKADLSYDEYNADAFDQNFEPGTYYIYMRGLAVFENGEEATAESDTVCLVVSAVQTEPIVSTHTWDFTQFSETTVANLIADAAESKTSGWSDVEKKADAEADVDPTELSKDNCFWLADNANVDGYLTANGQVIEELEGLVFQNETYNNNRSLAIAVNYGSIDTSKDFGPYHGGSYLWLGGKNFDAFTIKNVKAGTTITMGVESHKITDARGVKLMLDGTELKDPEGNAVAAPTTYTEQTWQVPYPASALSAKGGALSADADGEVVDIIVRNTNGCHIYFIDAVIEENATAIEAVSEDASNAGAKKFVKNGQLIIATGNKQFNAAGAQVK